VLIADDHPLLRAGLRRLLMRRGLQVVAEAGDSEEAVQKAEATHPDVALLDLVMPKGGGLVAAQRIAGACPDTRVIMISGHGAEIAADARGAGAVAYIAKGAPFTELLAILEAVLEGRSYASTNEMGMTLDATPDSTAGPESGFDALTPREREILGLVARGHSSVSVASILQVSVRTIETHRQNVMRKLGVHSAVGLTRIALRKGLV
jgi:DNA-binding NarL/FixJ family response regulator